MAEEPEKKQEEQEKPAEEPEKKQEEQEKPAEEPEKKQEEQEKPAEEPEKKQEEQEKPAEEPEKKQEEQEKPAEVKKPEKPEAPKAAARKTEGNAVYIGRKPIMNYVIACVTFFNAGEKEICIKARGRAISRAVDTVELLRRAFIKDLGIKEIKIGTEEITREEGRRSNVSTFEITLAKTQ